MKLPFVSRFAYDEMKAMLQERLAESEQERMRLTDKLLRLGFGDDGQSEEVIPQPIAEEDEEPEEENFLTIAKQKNVRLPSALRKLAEKENAKTFQRTRASLQAAEQDMLNAFDEGAKEAS